jgi:hypothetical protein
VRALSHLIGHRGVTSGRADPYGNVRALSHLIGHRGVTLNARILTATRARCQTSSYHRGVATDAWILAEPRAGLSHLINLIGVRIMRMARFSPTASMKTLRLAVMAGAAAALLALGLSTSPAKADQPHKYVCSKNLLTLVIICDNKVDQKIVIDNVLNIGEINVDILSGDITGIDGDVTVVKVGDVLSNNKVKCVTFTLIGKVNQTGTCNGPNYG